MANFTVSGKTTLPDDVTPLRGTWYIGIYSSSKLALDSDGSVRASEIPVPTDRSADASISLPQGYYTFRFVSNDSKPVTIPTFIYNLTSDKKWGQMIETPTLAPVTPALVDLVQGLADDVAADAEQVATDRAAVEAAAGGLTVPDASDTVKGIVELATSLEATSGTDTVRAVTPAGVKAALASITNLPAGSTLTVQKATTWPARPTSRVDVTVIWKGADPSPAIVSSGTGGMLDGVDVRMVTP